MLNQLTRKDLSPLRWTLGVVVFLQSMHFVLGNLSSRVHAGQILSRTPSLILGGTEAVAAAVFLVPAATAVGSPLLLAVFLTAIAIHVLHADFDVGSLLVYIAVVIFCWRARGTGRTEA